MAPRSRHCVLLVLAALLGYSVCDDIDFGRELAATLKSLKMNAHFAHTGIDAGISDYLHKPLDLALLKNIVNEWKRTIVLD